ncbi:MAG: DUF86 domain-containing protein [Desulfobacteraceae bacterium]|nr:MAG: DUF86 domain-containing protein [Desulfobacteraceae bacterium]
MPDNMVKVILEQVLDALRKIQWRFAPLNSVDDFTETPQGMEKLDSICMLLIAIGESCKKIDRLTGGNLLAKHQEVDWKGVKGLRDIISHHYFDVDAEEIYIICSEQIPILNETIRKMLKELE